jgi:hypothetical protein
VRLWDWVVERTRGASRSPDDLALGTTRPGDFADDPETPEHEGEGFAPNPHEDPRDYQGRPSPEETERLAANPDDQGEKEDAGLP